MRFQVIQNTLKFEKFPVNFDQDSKVMNCQSKALSLHSIMFNSSVVWENLVSAFLREHSPPHREYGRMHLLGFPIQR